MEEKVEKNVRDSSGDYEAISKFPFLKSLTRTLLVSVFTGCFSLPFLIALFFTHISELTVALFFSSIFGITLSWFLLRSWEEKLKNSVSLLVEEKTRKLSLQFSHEGNGLNEREAFDRMEKEVVTYQNEIGRLKEVLIEARRGYEHQIDLLQSSATKSRQQVEELTYQMDKKLEEVRGVYFECEDLKKEYLRLQEEMECLKTENAQQVEHKESLLSEYQHTISEQRMIIEKKQRYIAKLEGKVRDLMYEIRSLLQLEEAPLSSKENPDFIDMSPSDTPYLTHPSQEERQAVAYDLSAHLHRCLEMAQSITGVDHLGYMGGNSPRFLDMSLDSYALDLRRLYDLFRDESSSIIFVWSPLEGKMLFCNNYVKTLLGYGPEKFIKDFSLLVQMGYPELEEVLVHLKEEPKEAHLKLLIRNKDNADQFFDCFLGVVPRGPFASYIIGILLPST